MTCHSLDLDWDCAHHHPPYLRILAPESAPAKKLVLALAWRVLMTASAASTRIAPEEAPLAPH